MPKIYSANFSQAHVTPNDSFSTSAYLFSVALRARDAKATGLQSPLACCYLNNASKLYLEASDATVVGNL